MNPTDADLSALCIYYLRDANHEFAHTVLSVFYAKLLRAQKKPATVASASAEFLSACKATATCSILRRLQGGVGCGALAGASAEG